MESECHVGVFLSLDPRTTPFSQDGSFFAFVREVKPMLILSNTMPSFYSCSKHRPLALIPLNALTIVPLTHREVCHRCLYHAGNSPPSSLPGASPASGPSTLAISIVVMRHLQARSFITALDVESFVRFRAIEDTLQDTAPLALSMYINPFVHRNEDSQPDVTNGSDVSRRRSIPCNTQPPSLYSPTPE